MKDLKKEFCFEMPTELEFGVGKIGTLAEKLEEMRIEKLLIVTDRGIEKAGILDKIESNLRDIGYKIYDKVEPNPKDFHVEEGAEIAKEFDPDGMMALGGGSPIDCAKGIGALLSGEDDDIREYFGKDTVEKEILPFIAVPTTAGTGSEVTFSSVITDSASNNKESIRSPFIAPDLSILDPELTTSLPKNLTAYSGMDAFTHAIEAYTAKTATTLTNNFALGSMELILKNIEKAYQKPKDMDSRSAMLLGSTIAGIAFNHSDVASVHCMAESLGGKYDAPHGLCNSIILPYVMEYNKEYCLEKYARVAELMGYEYETIEQGAIKSVEGIKELNEKLKIPSIDEIGFRQKDIEELAEMSVNNLSNESNPREMKKEDYIRLFRKMR
ncbi:MAG: iron-containing alcohol dehydrogenase [Candidatus Thermoplasmatota archaeon]|nr:iron-containing alcohol dehydrogenase [Candidatus Thermoplasmatota archaeon]MBS3790292.1 iron-containing alcohol dehydrogenase [Candidatus Thermoplasmatota archaeon]